jgi:hypothetical protein
MATQILSTNGSYTFNNDVIAAIPVEDLAQYGLAATQNVVESTTVYNINNSQSFPQTPPSWVMASAFLALLVESGAITVE